MSLIIKTEKEATKRPLAFFACAYFVASLAVTHVSQTFLLTLAGICAVAFLFVFLKYKRQKKASTKILLPCIILSVIFLVCSFSTIFYKLRVQPIEYLDGQTCTITAQVIAVKTGYGGELLDVTLKIRQLDKKPVSQTFNLELTGLENAKIGDVLQLDVKFTKVAKSLQNYRYSQGFFINGRLAGEVKKIGEDIDFLCFIRLVQYAAGENIRSRLPLSVSSIVSAMVVGDERFLSYETVQNYRSAGISHLLNVSGLHFSMVCAVLSFLLLRVARSRRLAAGFGLAFVIAFALVAGLSPPVVRSATCYAMFFLGNLLSRRADTLTSMGFAALLVLLQNPYAVKDIGLIMSFTATLGVMLGGYVASKNKTLVKLKKPLLKKALRWLYTSFCISLFAFITTLPVLISAGFSISPLSVLWNILVVTATGPILALGLPLALPLGFVPLDLLLNIASFFVAVCVQIIGLVAKLGSVFGFAVYLVGATALAGLLAVAIILIGVYKKKIATFSLLCCAVVLFGFTAQFIAMRGVTTVAVAGRGEDASLVITKGSESVVLYRSTRSAPHIPVAMQKSGGEKCVLFVDLRQTVQSTRHTQYVQAEQFVEVGSSIVYKEVYSPMQGLTIYILKQDGGFFVCANINGYTVGIYSGSIDISYYEKVDLLLGGRGKAVGNFGIILCGDNLPSFATSKAKLFQNLGGAFILIRENGSVKYKEMESVGA